MVRDFEEDLISLNTCACSMWENIAVLPSRVNVIRTVASFPFSTEVISFSNETSFYC